MELIAENPSTTIRILGINQIGAESGNAVTCNGRDIPWLQDTDTDQVWAEWQVTYRDVVVLDDNNTQAAVYNLTFNDLGDPSNYAEFKQILEDIAANSSDCEGNFNCDEDQDVDGSDASLFKTDFGRSAFNNPCETVDPCNGDFDCDNDCDGTDASVFKFDFGRSSFKNPCPSCEVGEWCNYPLP